MNFTLRHHQSKRRKRTAVELEDDEYCSAFYGMDDIEEDYTLNETPNSPSDFEHDMFSFNYDSDSSEEINDDDLSLSDEIGGEELLIYDVSNEDPLVIFTQTAKNMSRVFIFFLIQFYFFSFKQ